MDFLEPEAATVAEALAFIDSYDNDNTNGSTSGSGSDNASSPVADDRLPVTANTIETKQPTKSKRRRRSKSPAGYSTRLLHRKKAEMQQLREQAEALELRLEQLKKTRAIGTKPLELHVEQLKQKADCKWMEMAMIEFHRRQQSEVTNRRLKEVLANQLKVDDALRALVTRKSILTGMKYVLGMTPSLQDPLPAVDNSQVIMAQLEKKVADMYLGSSVVFPVGTEAVGVSSQMKRRLDRHLGTTVEIQLTAPLACSMETASDALWKELTTLRVYPDKSYRYMQTSEHNSMQKNFDQILRGKDGATPVNGLQFMRKFEEESRIVLARAYKMLLPTDGMHLGCYAWTVLSQSETNPAEACEVKFFVQLFMEGDKDLTASPKDVEYLREVAFETWSLKMRAHAQFLQEFLIESARGMDEATSQRLMEGIC